MVKRRLDFDARSAVGVLPNLLTMGNAICGFGAIVFISGSTTFQDGKLATAGWLILLAMLFDALDGKVARITKQVSEIGGQLDSLCDAVTFGVAPAFLVWKIISLLPSDVIHIPQKVAWVFAVLYLACVLLRLARFNVTTDLTDETHMSFKGLPSPAAAGVIASLTVLNFEIYTDSEFKYVGVVYGFFLVIPVLALILGLLMVSKVPYIHILNSVSRGKRTFGFLVQVIFTLGALFVLPYYSLPFAIVFLIYAFWPPIFAVFKRPAEAMRTDSPAPSSTDPAPDSPP